MSTRVDVVRSSAVEPPAPEPAGGAASPPAAASAPAAPSGTQAASTAASRVAPPRRGLSRGDRAVLAAAFTLTLGGLALPHVLRLLEPRLTISEAPEAPGFPVQGVDPWGRSWRVKPAYAGCTTNREVPTGLGLALAGPDSWLETHGAAVCWDLDDREGSASGPMTTWTRLDRFRLRPITGGGQRAFYAYSRGPNGEDEGGRGDDVFVTSLGALPIEKLHTYGRADLLLLALLLLGAHAARRLLLGPRGETRVEVARALAGALGVAAAVVSVAALAELVWPGAQERALRPLLSGLPRVGPGPRAPAAAAAALTAAGLLAGAALALRLVRRRAAA